MFPSGMIAGCDELLISQSIAERNGSAQKVAKKRKKRAKIFRPKFKICSETAFNGAQNAFPGITLAMGLILTIKNMSVTIENIGVTMKNMGVAMKNMGVAMDFNMGGAVRGRAPGRKRGAGRLQPIPART